MTQDAVLFIMKPPGANCKKLLTNHRLPAPVRLWCWKLISSMLGLNYKTTMSPLSLPFLKDSYPSYHRGGGARSLCSFQWMEQCPCTTCWWVDSVYFMLHPWHWLPCFHFSCISPSRFCFLFLSSWKFSFGDLFWGSRKWYGVWDPA